MQKFILLFSLLMCIFKYKINEENRNKKITTWTRSNSILNPTINTIESMQQHRFIKIHQLILTNIFYTYLRISYNHMICLVKSTPCLTLPSLPSRLSPAAYTCLVAQSSITVARICMGIGPSIGSMGNLPWATSLKKTDYPPLSYQPAIDPELWEGLHIHPRIWLI